MIKKVLGFGIGAALSAAVIHFYDKHKFQKQIDDYEKSLQDLRNECDHVQKQYDILEAEYEHELDRYTTKNCIYDLGTKAYRKIMDIDLIADISNIENIEMRDKALSIISNTIDKIREVFESEPANDLFDDSSRYDEVVKAVNVYYGGIIDSYIDNMTSNIKSILEEYENILDEEEEDEDDVFDDEEIIPISPRSIIFKCFNGNPKIFNTDGLTFELLPNSDVDENIYYFSINSDTEAKELYEFFKAGLAPQLQSHYTARIDVDVFNEVLDNITINFLAEFINDDDMEIKGYSAGDVHFNLMRVENKYYYTEGDDLLQSDIVRFIRSDSGNTTVSTDKKTTETSKEETLEKKEKVLIDLTKSDDMIEYLVETLQYNENALKAFFAKLVVLKNENFGAFVNISDLMSDMIGTLQDLQTEDKFTESARGTYHNILHKLIDTVKKDYGAQIKNSKYNHQ